MMYNRAEGGNGGRTRATGWHHTEESKKKMSEHHNYNIHKNRPAQSEEAKKKIGLANSGEKNGMYGKHHSEETKKRLSESTHNNKLGTIHTQESRKKMSESHKGIAKGRISINKDGVIKYLNSSQLDQLEDYLAKG